MENVFQEAIEKGLVLKNLNKEKGLTTYRYIHGGVDFSKNNLSMARGTTLDENNNIVIRGMNKFFNYKQLDSYEVYSDEYKKVHSDLTQTENISVYEKLDGTMILLSVYKDEFVVATSSATTSPYSINAKKYFSELSNAKELMNYIKRNNITLVFEFVSYKNWIVVKYEEEKYVLTQVLKKEIEEQRLSRKEVVSIANRFNFEIAKEFKMNLQEILDYQKNNNETEGFVVVNSYNKLIKFKTDYWFENARNVSKLFYSKQLTNNFIDRIIELSEEDKMDDIVAYNNQFIYNNLINLVTSIYNELKQEYLELSEKYKNKTNKEIYLDNSLDNYQKFLLVNKWSHKNIKKIITKKVKERS